MSYTSASLVEASWLEKNKTALYLYSEDYQEDEPEEELKPLDISPITFPNENDKELTYNINDQDKRKILFFSYALSDNGYKARVKAQVIKIKNISSHKVKVNISTYPKDLSWLEIEGGNNKTFVIPRKKNISKRVKLILEALQEKVDSFPEKIDSLRGEIIIHKEPFPVSDQKIIVIPVIVLLTQTAPKLRTYPSEWDFGEVWLGKRLELPLRIENHMDTNIHLTIEDLPAGFHINNADNKKIIASRKFSHLNLIINTEALGIGCIMREFKLNWCDGNSSGHRGMMRIAIKANIYCYFASIKDLINFKDVKIGEEKSEEVSFLFSHNYLVSFKNPFISSPDEELKKIFEIEPLNNINSFKLICRPQNNFKPRIIKNIYLIVESVNKGDKVKIEIRGNIVS